VIGYSPSTSAQLYKTASPGTIANPSSLVVDTANRVLAGDAQTLAVSYINVPGGGIGLILHADAFSTDPAVTVAPNGDVFIAGGNDNTIGDNVDGTSQISTYGTGCQTFGPAFDASKALWTFSGSGLCREPSPYNGTQGQFISPNNAGNFTSLAIDGLGQLWAGLTGSSSLIEVTPSAASNNYFGSPHNVLLPKTAALSVVAVAIDQSGNVWLANGSTGGLTEVVGAAAPVATPRAIAAKSGSQGTRP
jgi:streptogramin lyase